MNYEVFYKIGSKRFTSKIKANNKEAVKAEILKKIEIEKIQEIEPDNITLSMIKSIMGMK